MSTQKSNEGALLGLLFLLFGAMFFQVGVGGLLQSARLNQNGVITSGIVQETVVIPYGGGCEVDAIVRFVTKEGESRVMHACADDAFFPLKVGDRVPLIYDRDNPNDVMINSPYQGSTLPTIFAVIGGAVALVGTSMIATVLAPHIRARTRWTPRSDSSGDGSDDGGD